MPLPEPEPGLVISYEYLWRHERNEGRDEASKTRPCAIVLVAERQADGAKLVLVAPITHRRPASLHAAVELPPKVKQHLGLDAQPSWAIVDEFNSFAWPGFDLRPVPGSRDRFAYGFLPPRLFARIVERIAHLRRSGATPRTIDRA